MICLYQYLILKGYFRCIDHKFPEVGHTYLDSNRDFGRIEKLLRKYDTVLKPDKYREIISTASRKNQVMDMAQHFRTISDLPHKLRVINRKKDELNKPMRFRDGIKWIRVERSTVLIYIKNHIFIPKHWSIVIASARKKKPFQVIEMCKDDFFSTKRLENAVTNRKIGEGGVKVHSSTKHLFGFKLSNSKEILFDTADVRKRKTVSTVETLDLLYPNGRPIEEKKCKDLQN
nr:unnamed protein product [Callosobruchus analis]